MGNDGNKVYVKKADGQIVLGFNLDRDAGKISSSEKSIIVAKYDHTHINDKGEKVRVTLLAYKPIPPSEIDMWV